MSSRSLLPVFILASLLAYAGCRSPQAGASASTGSSSPAPSSPNTISPNSVSPTTASPTNASPTAFDPSATAPDSSTPAAAAAGHVWKMRKVSTSTQVSDPRTNANLQLTGMTMLVPDDWTFEGGPTVPPKLDCTFTTGRFTFLAASPDKSIGLRVLPTGTTLWSTNRQVLAQVDQTNRGQFSNINCPIVQTKTLAQLLTEAAPKILPGATVVGEPQPVPGLSDELGPALEQTNQQLGSQGAHLAAQAARIRITATFEGKPIEAWIVGLRTVRTNPAPGGGVIELSDLPMLAVLYAPPGQLDSNEKMLSAMLDSVQVTPEWAGFCADYVAKLVRIRQQAMNQVSQIYANMAADNLRAAAQQQAIRSGAQQYAGQVYSHVASDRAAALDHSAQQFSLHMGDEAIYKDPSTGQRVQMSSQYSHAWASTTGNTNEYILTDSPSYNPNGQAGSGSWTQMQQEH